MPLPVDLPVPVELPVTVAHSLEKQSELRDHFQINYIIHWCNVHIWVYSLFQAIGLYFAGPIGYSFSFRNDRVSITVASY